MRLAIDTNLFAFGPNFTESKRVRIPPNLVPTGISQIALGTRLGYRRDRELGFFMVVNRESVIFLSVKCELTKKKWRESWIRGPFGEPH